MLSEGVEATSERQGEEAALKSDFEFAPSFFSPGNRQNDSG